jgi:hypothetical protein
MQPIIAGRFQTFEQADSTAALMTEHINTHDICIFYNNPPGQHHVLVSGGDEKTDPEAINADKSAKKVATSAGLGAGAIGLFGGPVVALSAAGIGSYTGSLVGALIGTNENDDDPVKRKAGVMLAVHITNLEKEETIVSLLEDGGALDIEHAHGEWRNGDWVDFNPNELLSSNA